MAECRGAAAWYTRNTLTVDVMTYIYGLTDPRDGSIRYIGKANNPSDRLKGHMRDSERKNNPVYCWIRKVGKPGLVILSSEFDDWREEEKRLIDEYRKSGARLLNVADGGDQPYCPTEVRSSNARIATKNRPAGIMRAYRLMEFHIRDAEKAGLDCLDSLRSKYERFKVSVVNARKTGRIEEIDRKLVQYFNG